LLLQKIQTPEQQKWASKIQGFNFEIHYKPGKTNQAANALSRKLPNSKTILFTIFSPIPQIISQLQQYYKHGQQGKELVTKSLSSQTESEPFKFTHELLFYKERLFIPDF